MKYIEAVFNQNYISAILAVFLLLFAIKEIIDLISYFKKKGRIKTGFDQDKENVENRLMTLEKHDNWQYKEISKMSKGIDDIKCQLTEKERADKERTVATLRNQLYGLHTKFSEKGYVDNSGLKTFTELGKIYEAAGGDDIYHEKLKPEVLSLPIKDD